MKLVSSPVLLLFGVLACAALVPAAEAQGGLLGGLLGGDLNLSLPLGFGVDVDLIGGESVEIEIDTPVGTIAVNIPDPVDAEAPAEAPSPGRKLLGVVEPATRARDNGVVRSDVP
jgi:hypothetical protein